MKRRRPSLGVRSCTHVQPGRPPRSGSVARHAESATARVEWWRRLQLRERTHTFEAETLTHRAGCEQLAISAIAEPLCGRTAASLSVRSSHEGAGTRVGFGSPMR